MTGRRISVAIWWTLRKSPSEAAGKPASMTSTPSASSCRASRSFSSGERLLPGACSPSRRVVSKIRTSESAIRVPSSSKKVKTKSAAVLWVRGAGAFCRDAATVSRCSYRHAAVPLLTNKDGKQEAKEDDDERETGAHVSPDQIEIAAGWRLGRLSTQPNPRSGTLSRGPARLDIFIALHNNHAMNAHALLRSPSLSISPAPRERPGKRVSSRA